MAYKPYSELIFVKSFQSVGMSKSEKGIDAKATLTTIPARENTQHIIASNNILPTAWP